MSETESITVTATVRLGPDRAFAVFTGDIGSWYRVTANSFAPPSFASGDANTGTGEGGQRPAVTGVLLESGVGGRFLAVSGEPGATSGSGGADDGQEIARITAWEPGRRFVMAATDGTEIEVGFEAVDDDRTKVTLQHRGLSSLAPEQLDDAYRYGPRLMVGWYELHVDPQLAPPIGVTPYVIYRDALAMIDWLVEKLGFEERGRFIGTDGRVHNAELRVNQTEVWVDGRSPDPWNGNDRPIQWNGIWVDDVDAAYDRLIRAGVEAPEPRDENYGVRSFNVRDPEGGMWGFLRRTDNQIGISGP